MAKKIYTLDSLHEDTRPVVGIVCQPAIAQLILSKLGVNENTPVFLGIQIFTDSEQEQEVLAFYDIKVLNKYRLRVRPSEVFNALELACINQYDDPDFYSPTDFAKNQAKEFVRTAHSKIFDLPKPHIVDDDMGGLRLRWKKEDREVLLSCNYCRESDTYIYYQFGDDHNLFYDPPPEKFLYYLRELVMGGLVI